MIFVTGANGFIGREVCRVLTAHGHEVVATDRNDAGAAPYCFVAGDVCDADWLTGLFRAHKFDAIIHLASMRNRESQSHPEQAMRVNIGGSLTLLDLAAQQGVARFVYGSSISAYGPKPFMHYGEVAETEPAAPDNVYGVSKRYVEMTGDQAQREGRLSFVAVRIAMVAGAGVVSTASMWRGEMFDRLSITQPYSIQLPYARDEVLPLIHVTDVAEMLQRVAIAASSRHTLYNSPAEHWTVGDLADAVTEINPHLRFSFAQGGKRGDPEKMDARRFQNEFDYRMVSIRERLRLAV